MIITTTSRIEITITIVNYAKYQEQEEGWTKIDRANETIRGDLLYSLVSNSMPNSMPNDMPNDITRMCESIKDIVAKNMCARQVPTPSISM